MAKNSGLQRYNLTRYNLPGGVVELTLLFSRRLTVSVHAVAEGRKYKLFSRTVRSTFKHTVSASSGIPFHRHQRMEFSVEILFHVGVLILRQPQMIFESSVRFGKDMNVSRTQGAEVGAAVHIGKWMHFGRLATLPMFKDVHVGKDIPFERKNWLMFDGFVLMGLSLYARAVLNVTIPPGG